MSDRALTRYVVPAVLAVLVAGLGVVIWQVLASQRLADGPVPIAWGKEACAHCHMHVSEQGFAVQAQTTAGAVLNFDDPGCFFSYLDDERPELHAVWFHHAREDRWLGRDQVGFVAAAATPMDFGLGAVDTSESGAMSFEQARERVAAKSRDGADAIGRAP